MSDDGRPVCCRRRGSKVTRTHWEVEYFRLLLVGPPLGYIHLAHVGLRRHRLDGLGGAAVLEGVGDVKVLHRQHVLQRLHGRIQGLSHLRRRQEGDGGGGVREMVTNETSGAACGAGHTSDRKLWKKWGLPDTEENCAQLLLRLIKVISTNGAARLLLFRNRRNKQPSTRATPPLSPPSAPPGHKDRKGLFTKTMAVQAEVEKDFFKNVMK